MLREGSYKGIARTRAYLPSVQLRDIFNEMRGARKLQRKAGMADLFSPESRQTERIRSYKSARTALLTQLLWKGRAWFVADSYQIIGLQTDLIEALPDLPPHR